MRVCELLPNGGVETATGGGLLALSGEPFTRAGGSFARLRAAYFEVRAALACVRAAFACVGAALARVNAAAARVGAAQFDVRAAPARVNAAHFDVNAAFARVNAAEFEANAEHWRVCVGAGVITGGAGSSRDSRMRDGTVVLAARGCQRLGRTALESGATLRSRFSYAFTSSAFFTRSTNCSTWNGLKSTLCNPSWLALTIE